MKNTLNKELDIRSLAAPVHLLVATDLNDGEYLIPHVVAQAKASNARVTLVHAILPTETMPMDGGFSVYVDAVKIEESLQTLMQDMAEEIKAQGVSCTIALKHGTAAEVIQEEILATGAERLIMASHGRGKLGQFLMGSVANQILGSVGIPVFVVGHHLALHTRPHRILHPVSLNGNYRQSLDFAVELARANSAQLTLLHVAGDEEEKFLQPGCAINGIESLSKSILPEGAFLVPPIQVRVAFGNRIEAIQRSAAEEGVDWIVLGIEDTHGNWPLTDSTAYKVMAEVECPVITLRHTATALVLEKVPGHHALAAIG